MDTKNIGNILKLIFVILTIFFINYCVMFFNKGGNVSNLFKNSYQKFISQVCDFIGEASCKTNESSDWLTCKKNTEYEGNIYFKTNDSSSLMLKFSTNSFNRSKSPSPFITQCGDIKLYSNTELSINSSIEEKTPNIIELKNGEITNSITIDGQGKYIIKVEDFTITSKSGLFKVFYDSNKKSGSVVVKHGLVEISKNGDKNTVKLTGFYKVDFKNGVLENIKQASVIQYNWR